MEDEARLDFGVEIVDDRVARTGLFISGGSLDTAFRRGREFLYRAAAACRRAWSISEDCDVDGV